ncbi:hypothetical protein A4G20_03190 [Pasteurellaceae bacterium RH1A]|nr:hypothetical protein A4G20_03190 [Pasteurellaceae bacterium RH1A]
MTNFILLLGILLFLAYAFYDQFLMDKLKGKTRLSLFLKPQAKADGLILIGLIIITIYQGLQNQIEALPLFLLSFCIILAIYAVFIRRPRLLLKEEGFFFGNVYFRYQAIEQINLAEGNILVIDLKGGRRLLARLAQAQDLEQAVNFFGGYKQANKENP